MVHSLKYDLQMKYVVTDHDADVGFIVYGKDYETLFGNAVEAVFSLIVDFKNVKGTVEKQVDCTGGDDLLIVFLNELLYLWDAQRFIPKTVDATFFSGRVSARVCGEYFDERRHTARQEVKAVTYHRFLIQKEEGRYRASLIVDV